MLNELGFPYNDVSLNNFFILALKLKIQKPLIMFLECLF